MDSVIIKASAGSTHLNNTLLGKHIVDSSVTEQWKYSSHILNLSAQLYAILINDCE